MPASSGRAKKKNYAEVGSESDGESVISVISVGEKPETNSDSEFETAPKNKKQKRAAKGKSKAKKEIAGLASIGILPLDLAVEIFSKLDLVTLVSISQLNKYFRQFLLESAVGKTIWVAVRARMGLMALQGTSEVQLASFVSDSTCFACGKSTKGVQTIVEYRIRLCRKCDAADTVRSDKLLKELDDLHPRTGECTLHILITSNPRYTHLTLSLNGKVTYLIDQLNSVSDELFALENHSRAKNSRKGRGEASRLTPIEEFVAEKKALAADLIKESKAFKISLTNYLANFKLESVAFKAQQQSARNLRRGQLEEKALEMDYGIQADFNIWSWIHDSLVTKEGLLSESEWKAIEPRIKKLLVKVRSDRLQSELQDRKWARTASVYAFHAEMLQSIDDGTSTIPRYPFPDNYRFKKLETLRSIIENDETDTAQELIDRIQEIEADLVDYREKEKEKTILSILNASKSPDEPPITELPLSLSQYNESFFQRFTSQFICIDHSFTTASFHSYPANLAQDDASRRNGQPHSRLYTPRERSLVNSILSLAKLPPDASLAQVRDLKGGFQVSGVSQVGNGYTALEILLEFGRSLYNSPLPLLKYTRNV